MAQEPSIKGIRHIDFNLCDLNNWMEGRSHEEIGRVITAIGLASQAGDESYIEQWPFIDRIVYMDGSTRKLIRGSGNLEDVSGIDRPIVRETKTAPPRAQQKRAKSRKKVHSD